MSRRTFILLTITILLGLLWIVALVALFLLGTWTGDSRWGGSGFLVLLFGWSIPAVPGIFTAISRESDEK